MSKTFRYVVEIEGEGREADVRAAIIKATAKLGDAVKVRRFKADQHGSK